MGEFEASFAASGLSADALPACLGQFFDDQLTTAYTPLEIDEMTSDPVFGGNTAYAGFLVAYYDRHDVGQVDLVAIPGPHVVSNNGVNTIDLGSIWRGETDVVRRLTEGVAWDEVTDQLIDLPPTTALSLRRLTHLRKLPTSVSEALEFACFLVRTTIDMQRFSNGTLGSPGRAAGCGGVVSALSVTPAAANWASNPRALRAVSHAVREATPLDGREDASVVLTAATGAPRGAHVPGTA